MMILMANDLSHIDKLRVNVQILFGALQNVQMQLIILHLNFLHQKIQSLVHKPI